MPPANDQLALRVDDSFKVRRVKPTSPPLAFVPVKRPMDQKGTFLQRKRARGPGASQQARRVLAVRPRACKVLRQIICKVTG